MHGQGPRRILAGVPSENGWLARMSEQPEPAKDRVPIWLGVLSLAMGGFLMLVALGVVSPNPDEATAPGWIVGLAGLVFMLAGVAVILLAIGGGSARSGELPAGAPALMRRLQGLLVLLTMAGLASIGTWIAFAPGARRFEVNGTLLHGSAGQMMGRVAFGLGSVITWLFVIGLAWALVRRRRR